MSWKSLVVASWLACAALVPLASAQRSTSAVSSSPDPRAERELEVIRASAAEADDARTEELARQFLVRFPRDPLAPRVELELGRLSVLRALPANEGEALPDDVVRAALDDADRWLDRATPRADEPTALRIRLYRGVVAYLRGDHVRAATLLDSIGGALVDADDRRLHRLTLHDACRRASRVDCALDALDALRADCHDETECAAIDDRIAEFASTSLSDEAALAWVRTSDPHRSSWPALASRTVRLAAERGDWVIAREIADRARAAQVELDASGREIAQRVTRGLEAEPFVLGIVAGLTGPDADASLRVVSAIADAAGMPPHDRIADGTFRIVVRDHHGAPSDAARALAELFFVHRAIAIVGPLDAPSAALAAERAEILGIPFLSLAEVPAGRFVVDASSRDRAFVRREALRRFGEGLAVLGPRRPSSTGEPDARRFEHSGGRIDHATRARLATTDARALLVEARPQELPRLLASLEGSLRRRRGGLPLVLDRELYARLPPRARVLEGAYVIERRAVDPTPRDPDAEAAARAFHLVESAHARTREQLADLLAAIPRDTDARLHVYRVRQGALIEQP